MELNKFVECDENRMYHVSEDLRKLQLEELFFMNWIVPKCGSVVANLMKLEPYSRNLKTQWPKNSCLGKVVANNSFRRKGVAVMQTKIFLSIVEQVK